MFYIYFSNADKNLILSYNIPQNVTYITYFLIYLFIGIYTFFTLIICLMLQYQWVSFILTIKLHLSNELIWSKPVVFELDAASIH